MVGRWVLRLKSCTRRRLMPLYTFKRQKRSGLLGTIVVQPHAFRLTRTSKYLLHDDAFLSNKIHSSTLAARRLLFSSRRRGFYLHSHNVPISSSVELQDLPGTEQRTHCHESMRPWLLSKVSPVALHQPVQHRLCPLVRRSSSTVSVCEGQRQYSACTWQTSRYVVYFICIQLHRHGKLVLHFST